MVFSTEKEQIIVLNFCYKCWRNNLFDEFVKIYNFFLFICSSFTFNHFGFKTVMFFFKNYLFYFFLRFIFKLLKLWWTLDIVISSKSLKKKKNEREIERFTAWLMKLLQEITHYIYRNKSVYIFLTGIWFCKL